MRNLFVSLDVESVFSDKVLLKASEILYHRAIYTIVTALQAGSLVMSSSDNQKETFKGSGRQDLYFEVAQITKRKLSKVKLPFLAQPHS